MRLFDYSTMPVGHAIKWDPSSLAGQAILNEDWKGVDRDTRNAFIEKLNSTTNDNTFVSKLLEFECFMAIVLRGNEIHSQIIVLENFQRFIQGPVYFGPYNWPDNHD